MKAGQSEKILHDPLSNYISGTYNTLMSVVQGVSLGGVFYVMQLQFDHGELITWESILKLSVVILLMSLLWHRYVVHNQFAVWRLEIQDTLIPIILGVLQFWLVLAIFCQIWWFSAALAAISAVGMVAYINTVWRYEKQETRQLFVEHFKNESEDFALSLWHEILKYQRLSTLNMAIIMVLNISVTVINLRLDIVGMTTKTLLTCILALIIILLAFALDQRWWLSRMAPENIRRYKW